MYKQLQNSNFLKTTKSTSIVIIAFCFILLVLVLFIRRNSDRVRLKESYYTNNFRLSCLGYYFENCSCFKHTNTDFSESMTNNITSTCSYEVDLFGSGQKVISFTLFDPNFKKEGNQKDFLPDFIEGIWPNLSQIKRYYPDWVVRIYTNFNLTKEYCKVACLDNVFWCDIKSSVVPDMEITNPRVWRFLPLGDPTVNVFISRDIDSYIVEREKEIVEDWIENYPDKGFHCARDSGTHNTREMLAGIWGAKNDVLGYKFASNIRDAILEKSKNNYKQETDEQLLKEIIFNAHRDKILQHESYLCKKFNDSVPFPKQRPNPRVRIAQSIRNMARYVSKECPKICRPSYGQNWTYC